MEITPSDIPSSQPEINHLLKHTYIDLSLSEFLALWGENPSRCEENSQNSKDQYFEGLSLVVEETARIVEMRKDMERVLELQIRQDSHFSTLSSLTSSNIILQELLNQQTLQIKRMDSEKLQNSIRAVSLQTKNVSGATTVTNNQIQAILKQFRQSILRKDESDFKFEECPDLQDLTEIQLQYLDKEEVQPDSQYTKIQRELYQNLFRKVMLRDELLSERQILVEEYQASSHELIETLLNDKEKDRTLSKLQKEKYQQHFREKHVSDIQSEQLSHSQSALVALYEDQLSKMKKQVQLSQKEANKLSESSRDLQSKLIDIREVLSGKDMQIELLQVQLYKAQSSCSSLQKQLDELIITKEKQVENKQRSEYQHFAQEEALQSQINAGILRISQLNQQKIQLSKQLEHYQSHSNRLQDGNRQLKRLLEQSEQQRQHLFAELSEQKCQSKNLINQITLEKEALKESNKFLQDKLSDLLLKIKCIQQKLEFTEKSKNESDNIKYKQITTLNERVHSLQIEEHLDSQDYEEIRTSIMREIESQLRINNECIDEAVGRLSEMF